jgi:phosphoribosylaminoimidazolecarboxamide formyltransferase/IMP cyclohydrolase
MTKHGTRKFSNALVSVSDKAGLVDFLRPLYDQGLRIVSTGGTAKTLREAGMAVMDVSEQTGFPECMDGRVKTLHPRIHMALLSREGNVEDQRLLQQEDLAPFDLLIVNLYPFESALRQHLGHAELIENIDIGGPSLLRGAAKNFARLTVLVDPADYGRISAMPEVTLRERQRLSAKAFAHVSSYDAMISHTLGEGELFPEFSLGGSLVQELRYGENPHQTSRWYRRRGAPSGWHDAQILQGKELSYNNLLDLEAATGLLRDFTQPGAVAVKHGNPCGAACATQPEEALHKCLSADPVSVFGGIVAVNHPIGAAAAEELHKLFLECVVAPDFSSEARAIFAKKKNLRLLQWPDLLKRDGFWKIQTLQGGFLLQQADQVLDWSSTWKILGDKPSSALQVELSFAWKVAAHLKSNAIAITAGQQTLGLGMGQVNRVDAVELAVTRMQKFHSAQEERVPVLASDAFFPFSDSIDLIYKAGIRWVIQPGGAMRDAEVFARAKELGVNLVLTGQRHFRH